MLIVLGRMRRKKCDEESPACQACRRNQLSCIWSWSTAPAGDQHDTITLLTVDGPLSPLDNCSREYRFQGYVLSMWQQLLIPGTPCESGNELISLGAQHPSVRDSFLACATLLLSNSGTPVLPDAVTYYSDAIRSTRQMIQESMVKGTEDWLFVQALLLCIFEASIATISHLFLKSGLMNECSEDSVLRPAHSVELWLICSVRRTSWHR